MSKSNRSSFKLDTDLISLRAFVAVVEEGSFSSAARHINRSQSAVSLQIAKLEERLGTKLLERTSRVITVTSAGELFVTYARRILELADEAALAVTAPKESTLLRVGFAEYLVPQHLHKLLAQFRRAHPNCDLSLVLGSGSTLLATMKKGDLDVVFAGPSNVVKGQILWEEPLVWTGNNPLKEESDNPIELVLMHPPCSYRQVAFDTLTREAKTWKLSIDANSVHAVQSAIRAGLGVSVLPLSAVQEDMPLISEALPPLPNTCVMSYLNPDVSQPYAERFIDYLLVGIEGAVDQRQQMKFRTSG